MYRIVIFIKAHLYSSSLLLKSIKSIKSIKSRRLNEINRDSIEMYRKTGQQMREKKISARFIRQWWNIFIAFYSPYLTLISHTCGWSDTNGMENIISNHIESFRFWIFFFISSREFTKRKIIFFFCFKELCWRKTFLSFYSSRGSHSLDKIKQKGDGSRRQKENCFNLSEGRRWKFMFLSVIGLRMCATFKQNQE